MSDEAEVFAKFHDEHMEYGGVSKEFHVRAAAFLRLQAARITAMEAQLAMVRGAADLAGRYGMIDGGDHKQWVIDQMLRLILGDGYNAWVVQENADPDYDPWEVGIAP